MYQYVTRDHLSSIYDIQAFTNSFLVRAAKEQNYNLLDSLSRILLSGATTLRNVTWYPSNSWQKIDSTNLGGIYRMWLFPRTMTINGQQVIVREEYHLSSSQFLFLASQTLLAGLSAPQGVYPGIDSLVAIFPEILLKDHYQRWILGPASFRMSGWGCAAGTYTHREFLRMKKNRMFLFKPKICPVINDIDLFIIAGLAQMVAAHTTDPVRVPISPEVLTQYRQYLQEAESLLAERIELRTIHTQKGAVEGFAFDNGLYREYKDHRFAAYTGSAFPAENLRVKGSADASWDLSHARRFFFVFNAMNNTSSAAGLKLDYTRYLRALSHQFFHVVYADTTRHLFSNYFNGDNGWYRVNYHGQGFGYPPYSMSQAALEGGWFFLGSYYEPIRDLGQTLWQQFNTDPQIYNQYYGVVYRNYQPVYRNFSSSPSGSERFVLLQWLPGV
jgi:hypothetical protein